MTNLALLDFAVHRGPLLLQDGHAVLRAGATRHVITLQHPVDGVPYVCVRMELRLHLHTQFLP